jgi:hypothetical protein
VSPGPDPTTLGGGAGPAPAVITLAVDTNDDVAFDATGALAVDTGADCFSSSSPDSYSDSLSLSTLPLAAPTAPFLVLVDRCDIMLIYI